MGLKDLLLLGETNLSAGSFPGDTPISDPQSGFTQQNSPDNTYQGETLGQVDNGSELINTLELTALDNSNTLQGFNNPTIQPIPDLTTNYPEKAKGEFNSAANTFTQPYGPNNTYLDNINEIVDTTTNIQSNTLGLTALDVENNGVLPTALLNAPTNPDNTVYPAENVTSGEIIVAPGVASSAKPPRQYSQLWSPQNKYWNYYKNVGTDFDPPAGSNEQPPSALERVTKTFTNALNRIF